MPARFKTQEEQLELCKTSVERYQEDLNKYLYLVELQVIHLGKCVLRCLCTLCIISQNYHYINPYLMAVIFNYVKLRHILLT